MKPEDLFGGHKSLYESLDKGFPYDDADVSISDTADSWTIKPIKKKTNIGELYDMNYTKEAIINLIYWYSLTKQASPFSKWKMDASTGKIKFFVWNGSSVYFHLKQSSFWLSFLY